MSTASSKWARYLSAGVAIVGVIVALLIFFGRREMMGTRFEVSAKEAVNYSGGATEEDARKVADVLREIGFFKGERHSDVLLRKTERDGTVVSFVVNKYTTEVVSAFQQIGAVVADKAVGRPLTIRLVEQKAEHRERVSDRVARRPNLRRGCSRPHWLLRLIRQS